MILPVTLPFNKYTYTKKNYQSGSRCRPRLTEPFSQSGGLQKAITNYIRLIARQTVLTTDKTNKS